MNTRKNIFKFRKFDVFFVTVLALIIILGNFWLPVSAYENNEISIGKNEINSLFKTKKGIVNNERSLLNQVDKRSSYSSSSISGKRNSLSLIQKEKVNKKDYVEGEILVKYKDSKINLETYSGRIVATNFAIVKSMEKVEDLRKNNISVLKIKDGKTVEQKIVEIKNDPNIEYAEPNYKRYPANINTNDTYRDNLWGLDNTGLTINGTTGTDNKDIDAPEAWEINEGINDDVIIAVIDDGVAYNHPDLQANMWVGTNCVKEDGNLLGNCNHGYDFENDDKIPLPDESSHGTHIAGTIAAVKNNAKGIIGVAPQAKIMAIKFDFDILSEIKAIDFAIRNGAKIINASFGGSGFSQAEEDAINRFKTAGGIFIAAAGNNGTNNESVHEYPSDYDLNNIISIAATDQNDNLASFSNYSTNSVDVGAPGVNIYSTVIAEESAYSSVLNESFETITPPAIPLNFISTGYFGTYALDGGTYWGKVLYGDLSYPYTNNVDTTITSPSYNLNASGATIDFWTKCDTEYITTDWADYMQLEYSADGSTFSPAVDPYFGDEFRWDEPTLDLLNGEDPLNSADGALFHYANISIPEKYLTSNFKLRLRWVTNSSDNNYDGCLVDDIKITKQIVVNDKDGSDEKYDYKNGTSMAAPHVAGLAGLIWGFKPELSYSEVKDTILTTGDDIPSLHGITSSGRRINAQKALETINPAKAITAFNLASPEVVGVVNESTHTVALSVPYGTDVTALVPTITITGATISPNSGVAQDFTSPVTYTVTAADSSTQTYVVTVTVEINPDTTAPVITLNGDNVVELTIGDTYDDAGATALDDIDGVITDNIVVVGDTIDTSVADTHTITYNVSDVAGNAAVEVTRTVNVSVVPDETAPTITPITLVSTPANDNTPDYTFNTDEAGTVIYGGSCSSVNTNALVGNNIITLNSLVEGTYADCTITVTDSSSNPSTPLAINTFTIDNTAPVIILTGQAEINVEFGNVYIDEGATANDNIDGVISGQIVQGGDVIDWQTVGIYVRTFNLTDTAGNVATEITRTVNVVDSEAPVITLSGDNPVTIEVGSTYIDDGANASDNYDGDLTSSIVTAILGNDDIVGQFTVTYNVSDSSGNPAVEVIRTVNVVDTTNPIITLLGSDPVTVEVGSVYNDAGATANDNYEGNITGSIITVNPVNKDSLGVYTVTYNVTDGNGNPATEVTRTVNVVDTTAPIITLLGNNPVTQPVGTPYNDAGVTALDNHDGNLTGSITTSSPVNINAIGAYTVTYNVSDSSSNPAVEVTRTVNIVDVSTPIITLVGDNPITIEVGSAYDDAGATALDDVDGDLTTSIITLNNVDPNTVGQYIITYNVVDSSNNSASEVARTVNVVDTTNPVISLLGDNPVNVEIGYEYNTLDKARRF